jgi:hypothetical protein
MKIFYKPVLITAYSFKLRLDFYAFVTKYVRRNMLDS